MLPGITVKTSGTGDPYPIEATQIAGLGGENVALPGEVTQASSG